MDRPISRRDFADGVALAGLAAWAAGGCAGPYEPDWGEAWGDLGEAADAYPPAWQGLQGDTADAMAVPDALHGRRFWRHAGVPRPTGERYDLVVVGAGVSGMTAAYRWWSQDPDARILVLDNHDDVGGRARRNEFRPAGRAGPLVGYGGPPSAPSPPSPCDREAAGLLAGLLAEAGVGPGAFDGRARYRKLGMRDGVFCDRESFGTDKLVVLRPDWIGELPMTHEGQAELAHLLRDAPDWFPGLSEAEKKGRLAGLGYAAFLREVCRAGPEVIRFCHTMPVRERALTSELISALDAWSMAGPHSFPGFGGLGLRRSATDPSPGRSSGDVGDVWCLPDGDHGLIRLMVRRMIPEVAAGDPAEDVTLAPFDYERLDRPGNRVRVRLSSPAVLVRNDGSADAAASATVGYYDGEAVRTVRAGAVVLACPHGVIPHLVPDLPPEWRDALERTVRAPVLCATAQLRNWRSWHAAGVDRVRFTGAYWPDVRLAPSLDTATYRAPADPDEPILAYLVRPAVRADAGADPRAAVAAGRRELTAVPYRHLEFTVREQLARLLGAHGFDPARDVQGLTINRWTHGVPLGPTAERPAKRFGRIAIAGSDSAPGANAAITTAILAVDELRADRPDSAARSGQGV
ncbi:NAD(P)-binding protein [Thermopolyspora sp. NPDC052614]|uniref:NAD(P)/FAD-dependent oxidoreductase n=1 Tax=Thermopolyspora sp. NPDC052614 TaxID=3155682 RepID=UPI003448FE4E